MSTYAGTGTQGGGVFGFSGSPSDGPALQATFVGPLTIFCLSSTWLFVSDYSVFQQFLGQGSTYNQYLRIINKGLS